MIISTVENEHKDSEYLRLLLFFRKKNPAGILSAGDWILWCCPSDKTAKIEIPCHSRCGTIKIPPCWILKAFTDNGDVSIWHSTSIFNRWNKHAWRTPCSIHTLLTTKFFVIHNIYIKYIKMFDCKNQERLRFYVSG